MEKLIKRLIVLALTAGASGTVFLIAILVWYSSQSQSSAAATTAAESASADKTPEEKGDTADGEGRGTPPETNWKGAKQWGVRFFRWIVIPLALLMLITLTILLYNRERITLKGLGGIFLVVIVIGLLAILGHKTYKWWLSRPAVTPSAIPDEGSASLSATAAVPFASSSRTERVTTKTIIARPDEWSEMIYIPSGHWFRWQAEIDGCMLIKNGRGQIRRVCGDDYVPKSDNLSLLDGMMAFQYPDGEVEVTVEWEPK